MLKYFVLIFGLSCVISNLNVMSSEVPSNPRTTIHNKQKRSFIEPLFVRGNNIVKVNIKLLL